MISASFRRQVRRLVVPQEMDASIYPLRVRVDSSSIPGGGRGVFYNEIGRCKVDRRDLCNVYDEDANGIKLTNDDLQVLCLYPGVYTPPLPLYLLTASHRDEVVPDNLYLAKETSPSGLDFQCNPYVLNLSNGVGGYIDAQALYRGALPTDFGQQNDDGSSIAMINDLRLDASPSACGHLINHSNFGCVHHDDQNDDDENFRVNVQVVPFLWKDVLQPEEDIYILSGWKLPNVLRCDSSPWYIDCATDQIVYFPDEEMQDNMHHLVAGAAITTFSNKMLQHGQELFLDYQLQRPYPKWATDWYRE